jgi:hypothetical protein
VDDLVVGTLKKRRIDRAHRLDTFGRESGGEEYRVFLSDTDVEELSRYSLGKMREAGAARHRPGDADDV